MKKWFYFFIIFFGLQTDSVAQFGNQNIQFGITANLGSHIQRLGVFTVYNFNKEYFQAHGTINLTYSLRGWGPQRSALDLRIATGAMWMFGADVSEWNPVPSKHNYFIVPNKQWALGFQHQIYKGNKSTDQATGTVVLKINKVLVQTENDLWGKFNGADKFRTGALAIHYDHEQFSYGIKTILWTGATRCAETKRIYKKNGNDYPAKYGYKDISKCPHSNFSHGIAAIEIKHQPHQYALYQMSLGRDSERVRNLIQNRFIHDLPFVSDKINKAQNLHIPMLDENGELYLYKEGQKIKKGLWYYQLGLFNKSLY